MEEREEYESAKPDTSSEIAQGPVLRPILKTGFTRAHIVAIVLALALVAVSSSLVTVLYLEQPLTNDDDGSNDDKSGSDDDPSIVTGDGMKKDITSTLATIDIITISGDPKAFSDFSAYLVNGSDGSTVSMGNVSLMAEVEGGIAIAFTDLNNDGFLTGIDKFSFTGLAPDTEYTFTLEYQGQEIFNEEFTTLA